MRCVNRSNPNKRRIIAFEGSFHGRTLLSLHASYNPAKRVPYEIDGYKVTYLPFPVWNTPHEPQPSDPESWTEDSWNGTHREIGDPDPLLMREREVLSALHAELSKDDVLSVIVEPMQSEGGDRYASSRFFRGLRIVTRRYNVPLIFDEVQTGFGLGGCFAWHRRFGLIRRDKTPDTPDFVTFAKRAQVGVVMSSIPDPAPVRVHAASALRGRMHLQMLDGAHANQVQTQTRKLLRGLHDQFPGLIEYPRATGYAIAFDLPSSKHLQAYLTQRLKKGSHGLWSGNANRSVPPFTRVFIVGNRSPFRRDSRFSRMAGHTLR